MKKPRTIVVPAVGALALALCAGVPAFAQQPGNQTQPSAQQPQTQPQGQNRTQQPQNKSSSQQNASNGQNQTSALHLNRNQIEQVQRALDQKGANAGRADGIVGRETQGALRSFQQKQKLQTTGQIDQQTLGALGLNNLTQSTTGRGGGQQQPSGQQGSKK
jgi:peptidoglycan hydrolase-like protein with peptidoglycan-binding domain